MTHLSDDSKLVGVSPPDTPIRSNALGSRDEAPQQEEYAGQCAVGDHKNHASFSMHDLDGQACPDCMLEVGYDLRPCVPLQCYYRRFRGLRDCSQSRERTN